MGLRIFGDRPEVRTTRYLDKNYYNHELWMCPEQLATEKHLRSGHIPAYTQMLQVLRSNTPPMYLWLHNHDVVWRHDSRVYIAGAGTPIREDRNDAYTPIGALPWITPELYKGRTMALLGIPPYPHDPRSNPFHNEKEHVEAKAIYGQAVQRLTAFVGDYLELMDKLNKERT